MMTTERAYTSSLIRPEDLRQTVDLCATALEPFLERDWSIPAWGLEWTCEFTLFHVARAMFSYISSLAGRTQTPTPFRLGTILERSDGSEAGAATLLVATRTLANALADVATAAPPTVRAFHVAGMADPSGFLAMGCDELLIHTDDILRAMGTELVPPGDLCRRLLLRLFPWSPRDINRWQTLRWANGRTALPGHDNPGPGWLWHCAPLEEWDGTIPRYDPGA